MTTGTPTTGMSAGEKVGQLRELFADAPEVASGRCRTS